MVFVHAFAGACVTNLVIRGKNLSDRQKSIVYALGIIGGIFPDFDLILLLLTLAETHRNLASHSLIPYTLFVIAWVLFFKKKSFLKLCGAVFYFGVLNHLGLDMLTGGLVALAPFSYHIYGFTFPANLTRAEWARLYLASPKHITAEFVVLLSYLILIRGEKNKVAKYFPWILLAVAAASVLILLAI